MQLRNGLAMLDAGRKRAVAGDDWHREFQRGLGKMGKSYGVTTQRELFQFGPGSPQLSTKRWSYPVGLGGHDERLEFPSVDADVPALLGSDELAQWDALIISESDPRGRKTQRTS